MQMEKQPFNIIPTNSKNSKITRNSLLFYVSYSKTLLLILAAVSISTLTGENGILVRVQDANVQTEIVEKKEKWR